jgi:hypothetical protein
MKRNVEKITKVRTEKWKTKKTVFVLRHNIIPGARFESTR